MTRNLAPIKVYCADEQRPRDLFSYLRRGKEIIPFESPNAAYDYANKLRAKLSPDDQIRCEVRADGHRVIMARRQ